MENENIIEVKCPCCENLIKVNLLTGKITSEFFNAENGIISYIERDVAVEFGYELGSDTSGIGGE